MTGLPGIWSCHREPEAWAHTLNAEPHLTGVGMDIAQERHLTNIPTSCGWKLETKYSCSKSTWQHPQTTPMTVPEFLQQRWTKERSSASTPSCLALPLQLCRQPPSQDHSKSAKPQPQFEGRVLSMSISTNQAGLSCFALTSFLLKLCASGAPSVQNHWSRWAAVATWKWLQPN